LIPRDSSLSSVGSANTGLTTLLDQGLNNGFRGDDSTGAPPRTSSASSGRRGLPARVTSRESTSSDQSTLSSTTMQNLPVLPPYPGDENMAPTTQPAGDGLSVDSFPPPPPQPSQNNALAALQRGGDLERRASRRYSAYQISKHLGASPNAVPMMPLPQNSPVPNRGMNDARESMRAVQGRDQRHTRQNSTRFAKEAKEASPARKPSRISEEGAPAVEIQTDADRGDSSLTEKASVDKIRQSNTNFDGPTATLDGPPLDAFAFATDASPTKSTLEQAQNADQQDPVARETSPYLSNNREFTPEQSPPLDKDLTIFLQYKTKIKKFVLPDGYRDLSLARLQLAFIEKFAWNTHSNGVELPEIYIQDPVSGVRHELEDLRDIKDRSVLVLNIEALDEVKKHFDEGLGSIRKIVEGVKTAVDDQQASIQRVSDRQQDTAKEMARLAAAPPPRTFNSLMSPTKANGTGSAQLSEIQSLKRDLAVLRQTYSGFQADIQSSMSLIRTKASSVKAAANKAGTPELTGNAGRRYVIDGSRYVKSTSDKLIAQVDDIQDTIESLRKDVCLRGVRPLPRQLEMVAKEIAQTNKEVSKMREYLDRETLVFSEIWKAELAVVCVERGILTLSEDLVGDMQDDLEKVTATFSLIEEATKELMKDGAPGSAGARSTSKGLNHIVAADPNVAKEGVLDEVRALQPNHENRLEAIERAEKLRKKELETRQGGEFQKELGNFVEEGKLKKAGGFEEVERARKAKDDRIRREVWERQNGIVPQEDVAEAESEVTPEESDLNGVPETAPLDI
jgi:hypothetical protein